MAFDRRQLGDCRDLLERAGRAESLLSAIFEADYVGIGAPTAAETGIVLTNRLKRDVTHLLRRFFKEADIDVIPFGATHWQLANLAYAEFGKGHHPAALNFGDCMTYATASFAGEPLLCCGDDFPQTNLELVWITRQISP